MKKNNLKIVKIDKNKNLFNYEKKILIKELTLDLKLGYYDFEKEKKQKVKFSLEIDIAGFSVGIVDQNKILSN